MDSNHVFQLFRSDGLAGVLRTLTPLTPLTHQCHIKPVYPLRCVLYDQKGGDKSAKHMPPGYTADRPPVVLFPRGPSFLVLLYLVCFRAETMRDKTALFLREIYPTLSPFCFHPVFDIISLVFFILLIICPELSPVIIIY